MDLWTPWTPWTNKNPLPGETITDDAGEKWEYVVITREPKFAEKYSLPPTYGYWAPVTRAFPQVGDVPTNEELAAIATSTPIESQESIKAAIAAFEARQQANGATKKRVA